MQLTSKDIAPRQRGTIVDTQDILDMANLIMRDLGARYSEAIYQRALFNKIVRVDHTTKLEQIIQVIYENEVIGTCRADIVTSTHVIEIKATSNMPASVGPQIHKYMKNLQEQDTIRRQGLAINFNQETERIDFLAFEPAPEPVSYQRRRVASCD